MPRNADLVGFLADRVDRLRVTFTSLNTAVRDKVADYACVPIENSMRRATRVPTTKAARSQRYKVKMGNAVSY